MPDSNSTHAAAFLKRLAALLIDFGIIYFVYVALGTVVTFAAYYGFGLEPNQFEARSHAVRQALFFLLSPIVYWGYSTFLESSQWQATVGKRLLRLYVTDTENKRIDFHKAAIRAGIKILIAVVPFNIFLALLDSAQESDSRSILCIPGICMLGYLINFGMVLLAEMHQSIHDKTAKTLVVERKVEMPRISIDQRTYNISGGQLVVTGDNPVLTGVQLGDVNFSKSLIDFANELAKVRVKVEEQSPSEERNIATAILNAAEADANRDDIPKIKERLSMLGTKIGKWVYDFAVEVGANLVAESIIRLNGLK